jgi:uncharacterized protein (DUF305 family)
MHPSPSSVAGERLLKTRQNWSGNIGHATIVTIPNAVVKGAMRTLQHLHFATRQPLERPGGALTDVLLRAFGIGATVTVLSVVCGMLLHGLPAAAYAQESPSGSVSVVQPGAPGTPSRRLPASTAGVVPRPSPADIEFMQGMIMHHSQAVEMTALIASRTENNEIRVLGARISLSQTDEIKFMKRWLVARGAPLSTAMPGMPGMDNSGKPMPSMPGMLTPEQMNALRQANGAEFDRQFLTGMIQHHKGALVMVKELFDSPGAGQDADLFNFATDADNTQRAEIGIMQDMLKEKE